MTEATTPLAQREAAPLVEVAWLYYHERLNQTTIAERMRISRASVVNYLGEARARGWVRVHLDPDVFRGHKLASALREAFGLKEALVVPDDPDEPDGMARVTRAAADWLPRLLVPGDRLGVSWGETIYQMAGKVAKSPIADLSVIQLLGARPAAMGFAPETCTSILAQRLGGACLNLHVPLILSDSRLRDDLCAEPVVAAQLEALAACNKTVFACGTCDPEAHVVKSGILSASEIAGKRADGATGVICARLIDDAGAPVVTEVESRMIGVTLAQMKNKEMALLVAAGQGRAEAARAALKGGFATHLATSVSLAKALLKDIP